MAGARTGPHALTFSDTWSSMKQGIQPKQFVVQNTTLGVILTNTRLDKAEARKLARLGQNALARVIDPVHTLCDGDIVFAQVEAGLMQVGIVAQEMLQEAIIRKDYLLFALIEEMKARGISKQAGPTNCRSCLAYKI